MMTYPDSNEPTEPVSSRQGSPPWLWLLLALVLVPVVACSLLTVMAAGGIGRAVNLVQDILDGGELVVRDRNPAILTQIQELGRLETASYTVEKVMEGSVEQSNEILQFFLGDRLLLVAHGQILAGVDMTQLAEEDVSVSGDRTAVTLRLPPARVLVYRLDNDKSYVYDRQTGLLTKGDPDLETSVRQAAEQQILLAACQGGILEQATENAERQIHAFLRSLGFVDVEFSPSPSAADSGCP